MKHLDLFSGIGGFALAARWMGNVPQVALEIFKAIEKLNK
jgi:site-specific DNA-cytosine methylase